MNLVRRANLAVVDAPSLGLEIRRQPPDSAVLMDTQDIIRIVLIAFPRAVWNNTDKDCGTARIGHSEGRRGYHRRARFIPTNLLNE